jgi:hypothetical protein
MKMSAKRSGSSFQTGFDRDHAVEHVGEQAQLAEERSADQQHDAVAALTYAAGEKAKARECGEDDARERDEVRRDARFGQEPRQIFGVASVALADRTAVFFNDHGRLSRVADCRVRRRSSTR